MIKGKKIFITGGAGFIGTNLIRCLIDNNYIVVYDNLFRNSLQHFGLWKHSHLTVIQGDIINYNQLKKSIPPDVDIILHMAAIAGIDTVIKNPVATIEVNMIGSYNILKALDVLHCIEKIERFVIFSTSEVFGVNAFKVDEKIPTNIQPVGEARWTYAVSKLAGEHLTHGYHKHFKLRTVIVRPFNVYGSGQVGEGAIHHFVIRAINNQPLIVYGGGAQIRSWCYIDDMINGILLCLEKEEAIGEVFNIGNPQGTITILGLAEKIIQIASSNSKIVHDHKEYVDVELRIPSIDKIKHLLGFEPDVDLTQGINNTIQWYRKQSKIK